MKEAKLPKIIVVLGPTASGKTDLGLELAKKFNGEIVSADSRQVYKQMDIGTAKPIGEWKRVVIPSALKGINSVDGPLSPIVIPTTKEESLSGRPNETDRDPSSSVRLGERDSLGMTKYVDRSRMSATRNDKTVYIVDGIPHHLMDIVDPGKDFSLADYKIMATKSITDILSRNKLPIVVGGTGLYIQALVDNLDIPKVEPNKKLREKLAKKKLPELVAMLVKMDPDTAQILDLKNPRRVSRALEVFMVSGESFFKQRTKSKPIYQVLQIGIDLAREELRNRINLRVDRQIGEGLVEETKKLAKKYSWTLPSMSGIGYKQIGFYLRGEMTLAEAIEVLKRDTRRYAKRQMTWFKRDKGIVWVKNTNLALAEKLVKEFLSNNL